MGPSKTSCLYNRASFHFHDYGRKGNDCETGHYQLTCIDCNVGVAKTAALVWLKAGRGFLMISECTCMVLMVTKNSGKLKQKLPEKSGLELVETS